MAASDVSGVDATLSDDSDQDGDCYDAIFSQCDDTDDDGTAYMQDFFSCVDAMSF